MKRRLTAIISGVAMLATPAIANAACTAVNLNGSWQSYSTFLSVSGMGWARCKLIISGGVIANTTCVVFNGGAPSQALTNGIATLVTPATCTYTSQFKLAGVLYKVLHGTLSLDHEVGNGVGTSPGGGFTFNMTKL